MNIHYIIVVIALLITTGTTKPSTKDDDYPNEDEYDYGFDENPDNPADNVKDPKETAERPRPEFLTKPEEITVNLGEPITLKCDTKNGGSSIWYKDGKPISHINHQEDKTLVIKNAAESSSGKYTCEILISTNDRISLTHHLKVKPAKISVYTPNNSTRLNVGDTLTVTCKARGIYKPAYKWYFNRNENESSEPLQLGETTDSSSTLTIENISLKHRGFYRCLADAGTAVAHKTIFIDVVGKPVITIEKYYTNNKLSALDCVVETNPEANLTWTKDGEELKENAILQRTTDSLKLLFDNIEKSDFGKYTCIAENSIDRVEQTEEISELPSQPLLAKFTESAHNKKDTVTWTVHSHTPVIECTVHVHHKKKHRSDEAKFREEEKNKYVVTYTLSEPHNGKYAFRVECKNEYGMSVPSNEDTFTIKGRHHHQPAHDQHIEKEKDKVIVVEAESQADPRTSGSTSIFPHLMLFIVSLVLMRQ